MLRESPNEWFGVAQIAKALNADSKVVSKVIAKLDVEDNGLAKRAKKYRSKTEAAELDLE
jgi:predicted transcriptional regulator